MTGKEGRSFFLRHWRGELPAAAALLIACGAMAAIRLLALTIQSAGIPLRVSAALELAAFACSVLVWLWAITGIVRLSLRRWRNGHRLSVVATALSAALISAGVGLYHREEASHLPHLVGLAAGRDPFGGAATARVVSGGRVLLLEGTLAGGSARAFAQMLEQAPQAERLMLRSEGGRIHEAEEIARLVRRRGLDTHVEEYCHSACTDILLAGRRRTAAFEARIGFHRPTSPGISSGESWLRAREGRERYRDAGVAPEFAAKAAATPADRMWYPSAAELLAAGVLSGIDVSGPLKRLAEEENRSAPRMLDRGTRLDGARAETDVLSYAHTVSAPRAGFRVGFQLEQRLAEETCIDEGLAALVGAGAAVRYIYRDGAGAVLGAVTIDTCDTEG